MLIDNPTSTHYLCFSAANKQLNCPTTILEIQYVHNQLQYKGGEILLLLIGAGVTLALRYFSY